MLLGDYSLALTAAGLTLLNNFLFVMARTTMLDVPMFMFSMWGLAGFSAAVELHDRGACTTDFSSVFRSDVRARWSL